MVRELLAKLLVCLLLVKLLLLPAKLLRLALHRHRHWRLEVLH